MHPPRGGRAEASAAIWDWRGLPSDGAPTPTFRRQRIRGSLQAAAGAALGVVFFLFGLRALAAMVTGVATLILFAALLSPAGLFAALERTAAIVAGRIGWALMWGLMVLLFYLFFLPFGLVFRSGTRDRLKRYFDRDAATYWNWEPQKGPGAAGSSREMQY